MQVRQYEPLVPLIGKTARAKRIEINPRRDWMSQRVCSMLGLSGSYCAMAAAPLEMCVTEKTQSPTQSYHVSSWYVVLRVNMMSRRLQCRHLLYSCTVSNRGSISVDHGEKEKNVFLALRITGGSHIGREY